MKAFLGNSPCRCLGHSCESCCALLQTSGCCCADCVCASPCSMHDGCSAVGLRVMLCCNPRGVLFCSVERDKNSAGTMALSGAGGGQIWLYTHSGSLNSSSPAASHDGGCDSVLKFSSVICQEGIFCARK